ncbi:MAG TPA: BrnA antitoxin family protein [Beijerinckiaceae bacterium]
MVHDISDEEEARIQTGIAADPENPEFTAAEFRRAKSFREVMARQAATSPQTSEKVSVKLDRDLVEHFKAGGRGWQDRLNTALRSTLARRAGRS